MVTGSIDLPIGNISSKNTSALACSRAPNSE